MIGIKLSCQIYTTSGPVKKPLKPVAYDFKNTGTTIAIIDVAGKEPGEKTWKLYPGEAMNTFFAGCADQTQYMVTFKSQNESDPESQFNELEVTHIKSI